jgi:hypothetical protein
VEEKVKLINMFSSQESKLYIKAGNAIRGLAEYRALQSRLNTTIGYVEAFEVLKISLDSEFKLWTTPKEPIVRSEHTIVRPAQILEFL